MTKPGLLKTLGWIIGGAGLAYFASFVVSSGAWRSFARLPIWLLVLVPVIGLGTAMGTLSWGCAFPRLPGSNRPRFWRLFTIRLGGEAINNALASAYVAGEPVKGLLATRHGATPVAGLTSAVIGKTTFILGEVLFLIVGLGAAVLAFDTGTPLVATLAAVAGGGLGATVTAIVLQQRRLLGRGTRLVRALRFGPRRLWDRALPNAEAIDAAMRGYYTGQRRDFLASTLWAFGNWLFGVVEVWVVLAVLTPVESPLLVGVAVEAGIACVKGLSFFVPGSLGVQEAGIAGLFEVCGAGAELGAAYALFRRFRELVWIGLGFAALSAHMRHVRRQDAPAAIPTAPAR